MDSGTISTCVRVVREREIDNIPIPLLSSGLTGDWSVGLQTSGHRQFNCFSLSSLNDVTQVSAVLDL